MRKADKERVSKVIEYIQSDSSYTFQKYLTENGGWYNADTSGMNIKMECPFHSDSTPSLYIDESGKRFKCFSCGRGGRYIQFVKFYSELVLNSDSGFYDIVNNILGSDAKMKLHLGFSTIFGTISDVADNIPYVRKKFTPKKIAPITTSLQLANKMISEGLVSYNIITLAIMFLQDGMDPDMVYRTIKKESSITPVENMDSFEGMSLDSIFEGMEF